MSPFRSLTAVDATDYGITRCTAWLEKMGGTKSFDRFFTDMHSSEQAGVLFIMELYKDITTTIAIN